MAGMLYYPEMAPPEEVLFQAVLYWDFLATIVPKSHGRYIGTALERIQDAGLYRPVHMTDPRYAQLPIEVLRKLNTWITPWDDWLPVDDLVSLADGGGGSEAQHGFRPLQLSYYDRKFNWVVTDALVKRGLARVEETERGGPKKIWVAPTVYQLLFSVAAEQVAATAATQYPGPLFTHTSNEREFWAGHRSDIPYAPEGSRPPVRCWQVDIGALLPVPRPGTPIASVLAFRSRYEAERRRLIRAIGALQHRLQQWNDDPGEAFSALRDELARAERILTS